MLRTRREERLREETQDLVPEAEEENSPNMYRDLKENVEVVEVVPAEGVAEKTEWMEKAEKTEMAEKADEIKKPEKTEMAGKAENEESELSSRPVISSSVSSKKASKSKPSGSPLMKILLLGIFFCVLLYGGWALMGGTEESSGNAEVAGYSGDAGDIGGVGDVGNDYEALSDPPQEPSSVSSDSSPEKVSLEKPQDSLDPPLNPPESFTNSLGMEFVLVPAGEFLMGSPETEAGRQADESPLHTVRLEKPFYMGKYEVTRAQWYEVMESAGEVGGSLAGDSEMPVAEVSWDDAQEFVKKLNEMEGTDKYRLPSEAEWEYACRAGSSTKYSFGDAEREMVKYAWFGKSQGSALRPVGQKSPNAWGLYDMHGNVWEWVRDSWHNDYNVAPSDGRAWESGELSHRIARGGSATGSAESCRAANRAWFGSDVRNADMGFRLVMEV